MQFRALTEAAIQTLHDRFRERVLIGVPATSGTSVSTDHDASASWALTLTPPITFAVAAVLLGATVGDAYFRVVGCCAFVALGATALKARGWTRVGGFLTLCAQCLVATVMLGCLSLVHATLAFPYRDETLRAWDAALSFEWSSFTTWVIANPPVLQIMNAVYYTLFAQPFLVLAICCWLRRQVLAVVFVNAWVITLMIIVIVYPFFPAVGNVVTHAPMTDELWVSRVPAAWVEYQVMEDLRHGALAVLTSSEFIGIISFPSFHAGGAVVLAWAFARIGGWGWAGVVLNTLMWIATMPIGSHYLVDVLAGSAVAAIGIAAARRLRFVRSQRLS